MLQRLSATSSSAGSHISVSLTLGTVDANHILNAESLPLTLPQPYLYPYP